MVKRWGEGVPNSNTKGTISQQMSDEDKCPQNQVTEVYADPHISTWYHTLSANQRKQQEQTCRSQIQQRYHALSEEVERNRRNPNWRGDKPCVLSRTQIKRSNSLERQEVKEIGRIFPGKE